jgi:Predicted GTPase
VTFAYSDVSHEFLMHQACRANAAGAEFVLLSPAQTMVESVKPVIAVGAVRTGCGKSQTARRVSEILKGPGPEGGGGASPDALRRPRRAGGAALHQRR